VKARSLPDYSDDLNPEDDQSRIKHSDVTRNTSTDTETQNSITQLALYSAS
jgi:hypothetical protein